MDKELNYEQAVNRLEEIVSILEKNEIPLDEALSLFEEGTALSKQCAALLNEAKQKISEIKK